MTIYIRPDGTISGSNEPLPEEPDQSERGQLYCYSYSPNYPCDKAVCQCHEYDQAITAWKESCIDFEDQREIRKRLLESKLMSYIVKPDTIIENVDVETEVVEQYKSIYSDGPWIDAGQRSRAGLMSRSVLRIKEKP